MSRPWASYPRDQFIADVVNMLAAKGIEVDLLNASDGARQKAASALLSSLSIVPTLWPEDALDLDGHARYNRLVHGD
jgi:hypothetical protein